MNIEQVKLKISKLKIEELAKSTGFQTRKPRRLDLISFLGGFWLMVLALEHSLSSWSRYICKLQGSFISKQALDKRLKKSHSFGKRLLEQVLKQPLSKTLRGNRYSQLFSSFGNVYVEDSTCISLPGMLAKRFPGPYSRSGKAATARVQLRLNLLKEVYSNIELQSYRDNDQKYAKQILAVLQVGDLVIRDLGYWSLNVFEGIALKGAFFLSRYRYGVHILDEQGHQIDLAKKLKRASVSGQQVADLKVQIGKTAKVPVRLVAIKAPQAVILQRKRAARKNRDRRLNHKKDYYDLLEWTIFITNVAAQEWPCKAVMKAYSFRWRIEIIFKCWKSKFKFEHLFKGHQRLNQNRAELTIYMLLAMLALFYAKWYYFFAKAVYEQTAKHVSPLKFADFVKERFSELILKENRLNTFVKLVAYYCTYEKRKRVCHLELLFNPLS